MKGYLNSLPSCAIPLRDRSGYGKILGCQNTLTVGREYAVIDRDGGNVIVIDDDGCKASFSSERLTF